MVDSIKDKGVSQPAIVRLTKDGKYEMVSGHRRQKASELAGFTDMPCIVKDLTDEQAITQMVEDNTTQRENILPSERAKPNTNFVWRKADRKYPNRIEEKRFQMGAESKCLATAINA